LKSLIVTGHLGFIGSAFCTLFAKDYRIIGVDYAGPGSMNENLAPGIEDIRGDIADQPAMEALVRRVKPAAIVNFAAETHVDRSIVGDLAFWHSNVLGARVLALEALKHGLRLVQVSTDEVYGDARESGSAWTEESPIAPCNPYAVTKGAAELMLRSYFRAHGLDVVITRGANTIGPRQFLEKAVPKAVSCFISGKPFPLYRSPARRMWLYVDDHARAVLAALERGRAGETYNIAPEPESEAYTHEVIERVRQIVGRGEIELVDDRKAYDLRYWMSAGKVSRELECTPKVGLDQTIRQTVQWYVDNPRWLEAAQKAISSFASSP
jgi:dTDP-glucose 4,6-dehydratase